MRAIPTKLNGPILLEPTVHGDGRGFFVETYRRNLLSDAGIDLGWVQDNHSRSSCGIVRGMHYQPGMAKLVRCARGTIFDVVVDIRRGSPTFGEWDGYRLDDVSHHQLYCPDGFAHGFCVLSEIADVVYKASAYYDRRAEGGFAFDDPDVGVAWPHEGEIRASERDAHAPRLSEIREELPFSYPG